MSRIVFIEADSVITTMNKKRYDGELLLPSLFITPKGVVTQTLFNFVNFINDILETTDQLVVFFNSDTKSFREENNRKYKKRKFHIDENYSEQKEAIFEFLKIRGINFYYIDRYEAIDVIGSLSKKYSDEGFEIDIYSSDYRITQLLGHKIRIFYSELYDDEFKEITNEKIFSKNQVETDILVDSWSLSEYPVIGKLKNRLYLLEKFETIENIYNCLDDIDVSLREKFIKCRKKIFSSIIVNKIITTLDHDLSSYNIKVEETNKGALQEFYSKYNLFEKYSFVEIKDIEFLSKILTKELSIYFEIDNLIYKTPIFKGIGISDGNCYYYIEPKLAFSSQRFIDYLGDENINKYTYNYEPIKKMLEELGVTMRGVEFDLFLTNSLRFFYQEDDFESIAYSYRFMGILPKDYIFTGEFKESSYMKNVGLKSLAIYKIKDIVLNEFPQEKVDFLNKIIKRIERNDSFIKGKSRIGFLNKKIYEYSNYEELLVDLKLKYGIPKYPYFRDWKEYKMESSIKRGKEGLYIHHDREDKVIMLSSAKYNLNKKYPFYYHHPENLTYANYIEHLMLHILISCQESNINFELKQSLGIGAIINFFCPQINTHISKAYQYKQEWLLTALKVFDGEGFTQYVNCLKYLVKNYKSNKHMTKEKLIQKLCSFDSYVKVDKDRAIEFSLKLRELLVI